MNYHHLRYFRAVAREGGLVRAAQTLRLSPSALSLQLRQLEAQLGHALFERRGRTLVLTEAGRIALDYAETVFGAGEELLATLADRRQGGRFTLKVGGVATLSRNFQLEILRPLLAREDIELVLRSGSLAELMAQLADDALDLVLSNTAPTLDDAAGLRADLVGEQAVSLVGRPETGAGRLEFPADLEGLPLMLPSRRSGIRTAFDLVIERAGVRPRIVAEVDDMAMLRVLAKERPTLALVPPIVVQDELRAGLLLERARIDEIKERFYAVHRRRRFTNPALDLINTPGHRLDARSS